MRRSSKDTFFEDSFRITSFSLLPPGLLFRQKPNPTLHLSRTPNFSIMRPNTNPPVMEQKVLAKTI